MNVGFVSTWYERGAAYVTRQYIELLKTNHNIFIYAREGIRTNDVNWNQSNVTWGKRAPETQLILWSDFSKWIKENNLDIIFFNEQRSFEVLMLTKKYYPHIKLGAYIDYYRRDTIHMHELFDFLICNTLRHYNTFSWHPQCYYVKWGTDTELFQYKPCLHDQIVFFHSMGMSDRKGTFELLDVFIHSDLHEKSKLIIHTQIDAIRKKGYDYEKLKALNVEVIEKTVTAPGLYHLGDVYVYPAELDGLGLTIYEALSCGLPVIGTDIPPINEPIGEENGRKIKVREQITREDGYYWPLSLVDKHDLYVQMMYYIEHADKIVEIRDSIRDGAEVEYNWHDRKEMVCDIFEKSEIVVKYSVELEEKYKIRRSWGQKLDYILGYPKFWNK